MLIGISTIAVMSMKIFCLGVRMPTQKGFSLIEIMVVVSIIGVLAAIAIPAYSHYQGRAKVTAGMSELSVLIPLYEDINSSGGTPTLDALGVAVNPSKNCRFSITTGDTGSLSCALISAPAEIAAGVITLSRSKDSGWKCTVLGIAGADYVPSGCVQVGP